jgi:hypothetical protein
MHSAPAVRPSPALTQIRRRSFFESFAHVRVNEKTCRRAATRMMLPIEIAALTVAYMRPN